MVDSLPGALGEPEPEIIGILDFSILLDPDFEEKFVSDCNRNCLNYVSDILFRIGFIFPESDVEREVAVIIAVVLMVDFTVAVRTSPELQGNRSCKEICKSRLEFFRFIKAGWCFVLLPAPANQLYVYLMAGVISLPRLSSMR